LNEYWIDFIANGGALGLVSLASSESTYTYNLNINRIISIETFNKSNNFAFLVDSVFSFISVILNSTFIRAELETKNRFKVLKWIFRKLLIKGK
jgi:hypothetical protein